jgi:hypothetical protein
MGVFALMNRVTILTTDQKVDDFGDFGLNGTLFEFRRLAANGPTVLFDVGAEQVRWGGRPVMLRPNEFRLLLSRRESQSGTFAPRIDRRAGQDRRSGIPADGRRLGQAAALRPAPGWSRASAADGPQQRLRVRRHVTTSARPAKLVLGIRVDIRVRQLRRTP